MKYELNEGSRETFIEHIETLEDSLDTCQEERDEWQRLGIELFYSLKDVASITANEFWWEEPTLAEQLPASYFPDEPGRCVGETSNVDGKSYCKFWEKWTNCKEVGHCTRLDHDTQ